MTERVAAIESGLPHGRPVVVLHGFTGDTTTMTGIADPLAAAGCRVISIDLIGHGTSPSPDDLAEYGMSACVDQIRTALVDRGVDRAAVIGYSMGARAALSLAIAHPGLVERLVLIGGTAGIADAHDRAERVAADEALADRIESERIGRFVDDWMAKPIFATQASLPAEQLAAARRQRVSNNRRGLANSLRGMGTGAMPALHDSLDAVTVPTLVLAGELDTKFVAIGQSLAQALPAGRFVTVRDAGHAVQLEQPIDTIVAIADFLAE